ncbi:5-formyltetrahydrofolate cyclo-ligase-like protein [Delitschia confertaspora ATCC 74209]|uniref:5-formyltetrahydrofolate cyclo-ligase n=1 Tax=Delitschia confertaspora ATCC 74209 TaxID=1513339 RepID=A0A9P4MKU9_9PLEO|nr:5-formyltetrahydrofolate cyclo-ligase-like protein [Delitschia confertaspora ATCC 74209]
MAAPSTKTLKKELRKKIKTVLSNLTSEAAATQSLNATNVLLSMPEYQRAKKISVYLSMPSGEISTRNIVHDALKQGKRVFIPYIYKLASPQEGLPKSVMDMLELQSVTDFESFQPDNWGIPTPSQDSISSRTNSFGGIGLTNVGTKEIVQKDFGLDMIVMPGMAFDSNFGRLGHGKGFYDYFLERCHKSSQLPFRVGLSLTEQFLPSTESVPMDDTDYRLDALVLGDGQLRRAES